MILNAYAVLDAFVTLLRLGLGLFVLGMGFVAWRSWRRLDAVGAASRAAPVVPLGSRHLPAAEEREKLENRSHLLLLLAGILLWLNVLSWPVFYLLLQSYIPQWPGVMCIYGVTRIGTGSLGTARFLPPLVTSVQAMKPVLVFLSGAWFVLHLLNRRTRTAPLTGRVLLLLLASGIAAVADAAAEGAYLVIPKKEMFLSSGCCTNVFEDESRSERFLPTVLIGAEQTPRLYAVFYAVNLGAVLVLVVGVRIFRRRLAIGWLTPLALMMVLCTAVNAIFLIEAAAPRLIHLPNHHCLYDLVPRAPESLAAVALFVLGAFAVGWACVAGWLGNDPETRAFLPGTIHRLLYLGLLSCLGSLVILSAELALA